MKTIPFLLQSHYDDETTTVATCLKITRTDDVVLGFTSTRTEIIVDAVRYEPGFDTKDLVSTSGLDVDNLQLTFLEIDDSVSREDLLAGLWNYAAFEIFEVNYMSPTDGINILKRGTTGEVQINRGQFQVEFRGLSQALQQPVGMVTQRTCRANFADVPLQRTNAPCRLHAADWTVTGTLTSVSNNQIFADSSRTEVDDWFVEGILTFTSGLNAGYRQKVKAYTAGQVTLSLPMLFEVQLGDDYSMIAGCRKRLNEDCKGKFSNQLNFQGEPHLVGLDALTAAPDIVE